MKNRALLPAIAVCLAAAGCDTQKPAEPPKPKTAAAVVPVPAQAPAQTTPAADTKATAAPGAKKRPGTKGCGNGKCVVKIKDVKPGKPYCTASYNAKDLEVAGANETITWQVTGGWMFDTNGIDLPTGSGQFSNPAGTGTAKYTWVDANTDDKNYKYIIRLKKGGAKCEIDPSVVNGAETVDPNYPPP